MPLLPTPRDVYQAAKARRAYAGRLVPGNIDLYNRPHVRNPDGSISSVRSITVTDDQGRAILIPTVVGNRVVSNREAIQVWKRTGQHLGIFSNEAAANRYARQLHEQQARMSGRG